VTFKEASFSYDTDGRMTGLAEYGWQLYPTSGASSGLTLAGEQIDNYDNDSRLTGLADYAYGGDYGGSWVGSYEAEQYSIGYDPDSRIFSVANNVHANEGLNYQYDADSQLANVINGYGGYGVSGSADQVGYTNYDANGNPDASSGDLVGAGNRLLSDGTYNYTYDAAGNMLSQINIATGAGMYFGYDADNRLSTVVMKNSAGQATAQVDLTYDLYGDLIGSTTTNYSYSGGQQYSSTYSNHFVYDLMTGNMVLEFNGSTLENRFLYGPAVDEILAQENVSSSPLYASTDWMVANYQGSIVDELYQPDTAYGVSDFNHVVYSAFGQVTSGNAPQFGYDGVYTDSLTGLVWDLERWYNTAAQRFQNPDPSGLAPDSNPVRYCGNDPVNGTDPSGLADAPNGQSANLISLDPDEAEFEEMLNLGAQEPGAVARQAAQTQADREETWRWKAEAILRDEREARDNGEDQVNSDEDIEWAEDATDYYDERDEAITRAARIKVMEHEVAVLKDIRAKMPNFWDGSPEDNARLDELEIAVARAKGHFVLVEPSSGALMFQGATILAGPAMSLAGTAAGTTAGTEFGAAGNFRAVLGNGLDLTDPALAESMANSGPVIFRLPEHVTIAEMEQMAKYIEGANQALLDGALSPTGRVSTGGALRELASDAAGAERAAAASRGAPYGSLQAGHVPDTTWTGNPQPYSWQGLTPKVNGSLGGQAARYRLGWKPSGFYLEGDE
jgi:RHS repeat-associated protein